MTELIITDNLIQMIMEDTGSEWEMAGEMAERLKGLSPRLLDITARWAEKSITDEELSQIKAGGVSLSDIMTREEKRFVEAVFSLSVLENNPDLADLYFRTLPDIEQEETYAD